MSEKPIRGLVAKPGLDGHGRRATRYGAIDEPFGE